MKLAAAVEPKSTAVAVVKSVPLIVTAVPPVVGPPLGERDAIVGELGASALGEPAAVLVEAIAVLVLVGISGLARCSSPATVRVPT